MADRKHPKTHVEDQDIDGLRKQPLSPRHEGIDPLTESDTMLPREDTKSESEKIAKKADAEVAQENTEDEAEVEKNVADQKAVKKTEDKAAEKTAEKNTSGATKPTESKTSSRQRAGLSLSLEVLAILKVCRSWYTGMGRGRGT